MSEVHVEQPAPTWLVYCPGRPTQTSVHASAAGAERTARRLAEQWPGHMVTVYRSEDAYTADRPPRAGGPSAPPGTQHF